MSAVRKQTKLWTTKDGRKLRICDMSDSHLLNSERMMRRMAAAHVESAIVDGYIAMSSMNGDGALCSIEAGISELENSNPIDMLDDDKQELYAALEIEIIRRGLTELR